MNSQPMGRSSHDPLRVVEVDAATDPRWGAFIATHPEALVYHHPAWLRVLEETYGYPPICLLCEDTDGQAMGILPLSLTRGLVTGGCLSSLPRTPVSGPLARTPQALAALVGAAIGRAQATSGARVQLKLLSDQLDSLVEGLCGGVAELTYVLDLPERAEDLRFGDSRNHSEIKRAVNRATQLGVAVRQAKTERDLRAWYRLYLETMRWHAAPPQPYRFFKSAWDQLQPHGMVWLLLAEQEQFGQPRLLSGSLYFMFGRRIFYAYNGRSRADLPMHPNDAIHWQAIHDACATGFRQYDFGFVATANQGLARFKRKWGSLPRTVYRYDYPVPFRLETGALAPESKTRKMANAVWRRLPLRAVSVLGDLFYSYL